MPKGISDSNTIYGSSATEYMSLRLWYREDYDLDGNTSTMFFNPMLRADTPNGWYGFTYYLDGSISIDGKAVITFDSSGSNAKSVYISRQDEFKSFSGVPYSNGAIAHNSDGSKTIKISYDLTIYTKPGGTGASGARFKNDGFYVNLTTIPRAVTVGASSANIEETSNISVNKASSSFSYSLQYSFGSLSGYINGSGNSSSSEVTLTSPSMFFNVPSSFYGQIPNSKSGTCTITCRTYSNGKLIGNPTTAKFTATASEQRCKPTVSGTVVDANPKTVALTGDSNKIVRYMSNANCKISASAKNSAALRSKTVNGRRIDTSILITNTSDSSYTFTVVDTRGYSNSFTVSKPMVPYINLTNNSYVARVDPTSGDATITLRGSVFNGNFGKSENALSVKYRVDGGGWVDATAAKDGNTYTGTVPLTGCNYLQQFTFEISVSDSLQTASIQSVLKRGLPVFDWGEKDFKFNVPVEMPNAFLVYPDTPGMFGRYGYVWSVLGNTYGKSTLRNYYMGVDSSGEIHVGTQLNNTTEITWRTV